MSVPKPTPIFRMIHIENLDVCMSRGALHGPNHVPNDGLVYKTIHDTGIQETRKATTIICGPGGTIHDYVSFYFGYRSPMLLRLNTGRVDGYSGTQAPIIYLVSNAQKVSSAGTNFVFSDGQGNRRFTGWYDDLVDLTNVDWRMVYARSWRDTKEDGDRMRRKQAEFLIYQECDWNLIDYIGVYNISVKKEVESVQNSFPAYMRKEIKIISSWYY